MTEDFFGKVVLVTGGGKGVGRGISEAFLECGASVVICGRNEPDELPGACGRRAEFLSANVTDADAVANLFGEIQKRHGRVDMVVNNAGGSPFALAANSSPRFFESIVKLNLIAPFVVAKQANAVMQTQQTGGVIIFIASVSAIRPSPGTAAYGAAKAGVLNLVQSLAIEWAPKVRVVAVTPGLVRTEKSDLHYGDEAGLAQVASTIPLGRMAEPADVGAACVFVASAKAGYCSGTNLVLHGGGERPAFLGAAPVNKG